jgi:carboxylesterase
MTSVDTSPFAHEGSVDIGVLVCHGFTGSPHSSMRPWAHYLTEQGWSVSPPLLPGHGTHWRDANRTSWHDWYGTIDDAFTRLRERCGKVFVCGLSMGGGLALRLAEERGDEVAGIVVVNPSAILALGRQAAAAAGSRCPLSEGDRKRHRQAGHLRGGLRPHAGAGRRLAASYHVATLDHDAARIFEGSAEFIRRLSA